MAPASRCLAALALAAGLGVAACETSREPAGGGTPIAAAVPGASLSGRLSIDGSSTALPVFKRVVDSFRREHPAVDVTLSGAGTGTGFSKLCQGQVEMIGASRPINGDEHQACDAHQVEFIELPFAFDAISVVVNPANDFAACLTVPELKTLWEPDAEGKVTRWNQVRPSFPDRPLALFGPGGESGTFDYFTLAVNGEQARSRGDYGKSDDDERIASEVAANADGLGYFGYSYYAENRSRLKLVAVDNGNGCVTPSMQTVADNQYLPLTRPMFVYASRAALARPEVAALARSFVAPESARYSLETGYVPLPTATLLAVARRLDQGTTGSRFGDRGSVVGVTLDSLQDEDKVKNALVR